MYYFNDILYSIEKLTVINLGFWFLNRQRNNNNTIKNVVGIFLVLSEYYYSVIFSLSEFHTEQK